MEEDGALNGGVPSGRFRVRVSASLLRNHVVAFLTSTPLLFLALLCHRIRFFELTLVLFAYA